MWSHSLLTSMMNCGSKYAQLVWRWISQCRYSIRFVYMRWIKKVTVRDTHAVVLNQCEFNIREQVKVKYLIGGLVLRPGRRVWLNPSLSWRMSRSYQIQEWRSFSHPTAYPAGYSSWDLLSRTCLDIDDKRRLRDHAAEVKEWLEGVIDLNSTWPSTRQQIPKTCLFLKLEVKAFFRILKRERLSSFFRSHL